MDEYEFEFDPAKNAWLQQERGIGFEQIVAMIDMKAIQEMREHHNPGKYPHQQVIEVVAGDLVYVIPCVVDGRKIFLKTIYPSRKAKKLRTKGQYHA